MPIQKRLVFRLMVGTVPDIEETKNMRLSDLVHRNDFKIREFTGVEPDKDYRLGQVMDDMLAKATTVIQEGANKPKVMFMEFTVQDGGMTVGLDLE